MLSLSETEQSLGPSSDIPDSLLPIPGAQALMKAYCTSVGRAYPLPKWSAAVSFSFFRVRLFPLYHSDFCLTDKEGMLGSRLV